MITEIHGDAHDTYGREIFASRSKRQSELERLESVRSDRLATQEATSNAPAESGVSIIVATYDGQGRLPRLLDSLSKQTLPAREFEVIVVENGGQNGVKGVIESYADENSDLNLRYFYQAEPSAGSARNLGLRLATRANVTFVDDDDYLGAEYLEKALSLVNEADVVVSPIINVTAEGDLDSINSLNNRIHALHRKGPQPLVDLPWLLGFNACKLVPKKLVEDLAYRNDLASGEDLVFWSQLLKCEKVRAVAVSPEENAAYYRVMRNDSISRRDPTFEFAVQERLDVISALNDMDLRLDSPQGESLQAMARAQAGFIARYVEANPTDEERALQEIQARPLKFFPWSVLNKGKARDLAFVYCFAPFSDTSAVVAAKAIAERKKIVDIIADDMSSVRRRDSAVSALADRWIDKRTLIDAKPSFAGWEPISEFARKAVSVAERDHALKGPYESLYSRALWVGSHVAGALFKLRHWNVSWTAEFSDPLRRDAKGSERPGAPGSDATWQKLLDGIRSRGFGGFEPRTLFDMVEVATFVLADELIFTNANQMEYMLQLTEDARLRNLVRSKATIRQHPEPPAKAYELAPTSYLVPKGVTNIAYFGSFYPNRGIGDVLVGLANSRRHVRDQIRLHVFSNKSADVELAAAQLGVGPLVYSNGYLSYMEFLNATKKFDILLVNDVERDENLPINPFLPSKLSDYKGSGRKVWGLVDDGSPLSEEKLAFRTPVGNSAAVIKTLEKIVAERQS